MGGMRNLYILFGKIKNIRRDLDVDGTNMEMGVIFEVSMAVIINNTVF
jgi:hypothetical protein